MTATAVRPAQAAVDVRAIGRQLVSATTVVDGCGRSWETALSVDQQAAHYGRIVHHGAIGCVEVAAGWLTAEGRLAFENGRWHDGYYPPAADTAAFERIVRRFRARGLNVFSTPLAKARPEPNDDHISSGAVVWVDLDDVDERAISERLAALRPHLLIGSGGGLHAYWRLFAPIDAPELEGLNRRLAAHLDGDAQVANRGRLMRVPGSWNERRQRPCRILRIDHGRPALQPGEIRELGPDPNPPQSDAAAAPSPSPLVACDAIAQLAPREYFRALLGIEVPRDGFVCCPLHAEQAPSCKVYDTPAKGWWCYGCDRGGRVYDLVSLLAGGPFGRGLNGSAFLAAKARAHQQLADARPPQRAPAPPRQPPQVHPSRPRGGRG